MRAKIQPDLLEELIEGVVTAADGMFLLAQLLMNSFQTKLKVKTIKADLRDLPKGLVAYDTAYDDAMSRIFGQEKDSQEAARKIMSLVLCAKRPLRTRELQHALMIEPDTVELDQEDNLEVEDLLSVCAGLITIDIESDTIRFVHYTTQEYLQRKRERWLPRSEFEIARACSDYLLMQIADFARRGFTLDTSPENTRSSLMEYANEHGPFHWDAVVQVEKPLHNGLLALLSGSRLLYAVRQNVSCVADANKMHESTPVHWVAELGLLNLTRFCIDNKFAYDDAVVSDTGVYSSFHGFKDNRLLRAKACGTPLLRAAAKGHVSVVRLLLEHNAAVDSRDDRGQTPLAVAAIGGHESVVRLLLGHNASVILSDKRGRTALSHAVESGDEPTVRVLLDNAADCDTEDRLGDTPLSIATAKGHEVVVQLLLERGAAVEVISSADETPLMAAARLGFVSVISLLLAHKADIECRDQCWETPLIYGVIWGTESVVPLLLENGAAVNAEDKSGRTALSHAADAGHEGMVRLLLHHRAVVDSKDHRGRTPLSHATEKGHGSVVRLLLENNAAVDIVDVSGQTPLSFANQKHDLITRALLKRNYVVYKACER